MTAPLTTPPTAPDASDPSTFSDRADALLAWMATFVTEANAMVAGLDNVAAGAAAAIVYQFSTTTTDADPGAGTLRLDSGTQNAATTVRVDLSDANAVDVTALLATIDDSTSTVKGQLRITSVEQPSKFLVFEVASMASPTGYRYITVSPVAYSSANPFANGDTVVMTVTRTGDKGDPGNDGADGAVGTMTYVSQAVAASAASVSFTSLDSAFDYVIVGQAVQAANDAVNMWAHISEDNGSNWKTTSYSGAITTCTNGSNTATLAATGGIQITSSQKNTTANAEASFMLWLRNIGSSRYKNFDVRSTYQASSAIADLRGSLRYEGTPAAYNAIRILMTSGNISGTFRLYKIARS